MPIECTSDSECSKRNGDIMVCYEGKEINQTVCDCSVWIGWVGERCDQVSPTLTYLRFSTLLFTCWSFLLVLLTFRSLALNFWVMEDKNLFKDYIFVTLVLISISALCFFLYVTMRIPALFDSSEFEVVSMDSFFEPSFEAVIVKNGLISNVFVLFSWVALSLSNLYLLLGFNSTIAKVSTLRIGQTEGFYNSGVIVTRILCAVAVFPPFLACFRKYQYDMVIFCAVINVAISALFLYISAKFVSMLHTLTNTTNKEVAVLASLVRNVCLITAFCLVSFSIMSTVLLARGESAEDRNRVGKYNYHVAAQDMLRLFQCILISLSAWFINSITEGAIVSDLFPRLCILFYYWDEKNREIFPEKYSTGVFDYPASSALKTIEL